MTKAMLWTGCVLVIYAAAILFFTRPNVGTFLVLACGLALIIDALIYKLATFRKFFKLIFAATLLAFAFFALMIIFISASGKTTAKYTEDAAIVLGAGIRGDEVTPMLAARLDAAYDYLQKNTKAVVVVSGVRGSWESISEALAMQRYLVDKGMPENRILLEDKSANTYQNLRNSKRILDSYFNRPYSVVCITSRSHLFRATRIGRKLGFNMTGLSAEIPFYLWPPVYLRETLALPNSLIRF